MDKEMSLKNRDRLIQLGITISTFRKYRGLSQEQLAERASVSRSLISSIEAAGIAKCRKGGQRLSVWSIAEDFSFFVL